MTTQAFSWLSRSLRIEWISEFGFLLEEATQRTASANSDGLSLFIQGFGLEMKEKNYSLALEKYQKGSGKLDPLCLCRLHDIYLGDTNFGITFNADKASIYLAFAGLYSQDLIFKDRVVPFKKLMTFMRMHDEECRMMEDIFLRTSVKELDPLKPFSLCYLRLFQKIDFESNRLRLLDLLDVLPVSLQREIMFSVYTSELRLYWVSGYKQKEILVLKLMQIEDVFSGFFASYKGVLEVALKNVKAQECFKAWISIILFVVDFATLSERKKEYYTELFTLVSQALDKNFFEEKDISGWLRYYLAYCYEKGIGTQRDLGKADQLVEANMKESPEGILYPMRAAILAKTMGNTKQGEERITAYERVYELRRKDMENSLLLYSKAKSMEKYRGDRAGAIEYYKRGSQELKENIPEKRYLFYTYWKIRCQKRLEKMQNITGIIESQQPRVHRVQGIELTKGRQENYTRSEPKELTNGNNTRQNSKKEVLNGLEDNSPAAKLDIGTPLNGGINRNVSLTASQLIMQPKADQILQKSNIKVFPAKETSLGSTKSTKVPIAVSKGAVYYADGYNMNSITPLNENTKQIKYISTGSRDSKLIPPEGVFLKERTTGLWVYLLTPLAELNLDEALNKEMLPDLKTKLHVAMQIALCLAQIHEDPELRFHGNLKPKKVVLLEHYMIKLYSPCCELLPYKEMEADGYTAPEQLKGQHDSASDMWAFGVILWEIFYGERVTESKAQVDFLYKTKRGVKKSGNDDDEEIEFYLERMIALDANERPRIQDVYAVLKSKCMGLGNFTKFL